MSCQNSVLSSSTIKDTARFSTLKREMNIITSSYTVLFGRLVSILDVYTRSEPSYCLQMLKLFAQVHYEEDDSNL